MLNCLLGHNWKRSKFIYSDINEKYSLRFVFCHECGKVKVESTSFCVNGESIGCKEIRAIHEIMAERRLAQSASVDAAEEAR